jgi:uncharacterized protein YdhG (YjbR/CyaY superfamily)
MKQEYKSIDEYIRQFPSNVQEILEKLREIIKKTAPEAEETISYQMPTFKLHGNLVHFAAYKNHIGLYPVPSGIEAFKRELAPYIAGKGTIRFSLDSPIPYDLIEKVVAFRVKENRTKHSEKRL